MSLREAFETDKDLRLDEMSDVAELLAYYKLYTYWLEHMCMKYVHMVDQLMIEEKQKSCH